jgi:hypothetical protein
MPEWLACGPCVEHFAERGHRFPQWSALRRWQAAVNVWATDAGLTGRELLNVQNRARTARAWSRDWLIEDGRTAMLDYFDGLCPDPPDEDRWHPLVAPGVTEPENAPRRS